MSCTYYETGHCLEQCPENCNGKRVIYFAHPRTTYGRCKGATAWLEARFGADLVNPEHMDFPGLVRDFGSYELAYEYVVGKADEVVVLEHDGHVGRGVYHEVCIALREDKPVHVLRHQNLVPVASIAVVDPTNWSYGFARVITEDEAADDDLIRINGDDELGHDIVRPFGDVAGS